MITINQSAHIKNKDMPRNFNNINGLVIKTYESYSFQDHPKNNFLLPSKLEYDKAKLFSNEFTNLLQKYQVDILTHIMLIFQIIEIFKDFPGLQEIYKKYQNYNSSKEIDIDGSYDYYGNYNNRDKHILDNYFLPDLIKEIKSIANETKNQEIYEILVILSEQKETIEAIFQKLLIDIFPSYIEIMNIDTDKFYDSLHYSTQYYINKNRKYNANHENAWKYVANEIISIATQSYYDNTIDRDFYDNMFTAFISNICMIGTWTYKQLDKYKNNQDQILLPSYIYRQIKKNPDANLHELVAQTFKDAEWCKKRQIIEERNRKLQDKAITGLVITTVSTAAIYGGYKLFTTPNIASKLFTMPNITWKSILRIASTTAITSLGYMIFK